MSRLNLLLEVYFKSQHRVLFSRIYFVSKPTDLRNLTFMVWIFIIKLFWIIIKLRSLSIITFLVVLTIRVTAFLHFKNKIINFLGSKMFYKSSYDVFKMYFIKFFTALYFSFSYVCSWSKINFGFKLFLFARLSRNWLLFKYY